jgi:hypothetical protein
MILGKLLISDTILKEKTTIHGNIDAKLLYPCIMVAQDLYIHPLLGSALYNKLKTDIVAESVTGVYATLLNDYVIEALIYYALSEVVITSSYQIWNRGVMRKSGGDTELPSMSELVDLSMKYKNIAESYANRTRLYLLENESNFPEYVSPGDGVDTIHPSGRSFDLPVNLDLESDRRISYEEKYQGNNPRC